MRARWRALLDSPEGAGRIARGAAAGSAAAMLPAFGLHLVFAAAFAWMLGGSLPVAAAACLALGNPLTHAFLLPAEFALGRLILPPRLEFLPREGPAWLLAGLPAAEEVLVGGIILALLVGGLAGFMARRALRQREAAFTLHEPVVLHLNGPINSGKSSIGLALTDLLPGATFLEGDAHGLPTSLPREKRWAGALQRITAAIATSQAPWMVVAYPLDEAAYRSLSSACAARGARLRVVTLAPPLEVALTERGGRMLSEVERLRIREMYAEGYAARPFSEQIFDPSGRTPVGSARKLADLLDLPVQR
ncbi:DUF2062 domain-containing protein [Roseomonas sp. E05]|uniref:DUF2062 domain-containing protein n=1 Tax=Roseomonas sp. E05 TaxID=3046310 RepID=UPI0024BAD156|nr:DUF2062 domain-containing protein [Roseomonas sp. E05]MDJ0389760.1 DUF2062 domain-containing protein [Roseomonas sp. E05]